MNQHSMRPDSSLRVEIPAKALMKTVDEIKSAIARLAPEELRQLADWVELLMEDHREPRPEFVARLNKAADQLLCGECRTF